MVFCSSCCKLERATVNHHAWAKKRDHFEANKDILLIILEIDRDTKAWLIQWLSDFIYFSSFHVSKDYDMFDLNQSKYELGACKCTFYFSLLLIVALFFFAFTLNMVKSRKTNRWRQWWIKNCSSFHSSFPSLNKSTIWTCSTAFLKNYEEQNKSATIQKRRPSEKIYSQLKGPPKLLETIDGMVQGCVKTFIQYTYYF